MKLSPSRITSSLFGAGVSLLCVFSSTAQASWSGPVYAVTNRQGGRMDIAPTTPNSGDPWPGAVAGTVKATFTWVHDVPGDAPPSDVYVLQSGKAQWQLLGPPPAGAMSQPSASVQSVAFSFGRKPRIYLAQTQTVWGTADDGLGHAQVVTTTANGQTGTSQGYKPILCHPTGGTLVTSAVTLSASATSKQTYVASWSYSAQIMNLQITRNGVDITSPNKPEVPVMVGERNQMGVSVSPVPQGVAPPTFQWTLPTTDVIKDYIETAGNPNAAPPTPFTAKKVELPAGDSTTQSPYFYWYNGSFDGTSNEISVVVTIAGTPITLKGKCKVYRPRMDSYTGTYTSQNPPVGYYPYFDPNLGTVVDFIGLGSLDGGVANRGITFSAKVSTPTVPSAAGEVAYTQLVTMNSEDSVTGIGHTTTKATDALDSVNPPRYHGIIDSIVAGVSKQSVERDDTPGATVYGINQNGDFFKQDSQFKMYLVYRPSGVGSIWVTLGVLDWHYSLKATRNNANTPTHWDITNRFPTMQANGAPPAPIPGRDSTDFPKYSERIQDVSSVAVTP